MTIYLKLWSLGCRDIYAAEASARKLISGPDKTGRATGWYFITHTLRDWRRHDIATCHLDSRDPEELAWVCANLHVSWETCHGASIWEIREYEEELRKRKYADQIYPATKQDRHELFTRISKIADFCGKRKPTHGEIPFPWHKSDLIDTTPCDVLLSLAAYDRCDILINRLSSFRAIMNKDQRLAFYTRLLDPKKPKQRTLLLEGLLDRHEDVKEAIILRLHHYPLSSADITSLRVAYDLGKHGLRKEIAALLNKQARGTQGQTGDDALIKFAGEICDTSSGFGLFSPAGEDFCIEHWNGKRPIIKVYSDAALKRLMTPDEKLVTAFIDEFTTDIHKYLDNGNLSVENQVKLAAALYLFTCCPVILTYESWVTELFSGFPIGRHPYVIEAANAVESKGIDYSTLKKALSIMLSKQEPGFFEAAFSVYISLIRKVPQEKLGAICIKKAPYGAGILPLLINGSQTVPKIELLAFWRDLAYSQIRSKEQFAMYFTEMWYEHLASGQQEYYGLSNKDVFEAFTAGLISDDAIYSYFTSGWHADYHLGEFTDVSNSIANKELLDNHPRIKEILSTVVDSIIEMEVDRAKDPTELSHLAPYIKRLDCEAKMFVCLLKALSATGYDFRRGKAYHPSYSIRSEHTKSSNLLHLLRRCHPSDTDTPEALHGALNSGGVPRDDILIAALLCPSWAGRIEKAIRMPGLMCGVYFFHTHLRWGFVYGAFEVLALFSSVSRELLVEGVFDRNWFLQLYGAVGEAAYTELYTYARQIDDSRIAYNHMQLYADAVLGKLDKELLIAEIMASRSQEKLKAYALIPLDESDATDAAERYGLILKYKKDRHKSPKGRQTPENSASNVALHHLAITTGYNDLTRMKWALGTEELSAQLRLQQPFVVDGLQVWLTISGNGYADMAVLDDEGLYVKLPAELAKNEHVKEIKDAVRQLRDLKEQARHSFENAMKHSSAFTGREVHGLLEHPILHELTSSLVFSADGHLGFPVISDGMLVLVSPNGETKQAGHKLFIAHQWDFRLLDTPHS